MNIAKYMNEKDLKEERHSHHDYEESPHMSLNDGASSSDYNGRGGVQIVINNESEHSNHQSMEGAG